ncbi:S8 family serine peptidase [Micromonospora sp. NBC_01813]|uniref:S8 family serine peptidase n=1 Tax=Micromonospora sp. NBC_01813 TaxID=2975988 RepID=UPI002DD973A1|nr:S8 family serine peptidase [Micromonospora sp. NBC_01813]WSA08650.1 S8 family serine peptidase [Micromonospora sp. NBC_01813]
MFTRFRYRRHAIVTAAASAVLIVSGATPALAQPTTALAPLLPAEGGVPNGGYIVVVKDQPVIGGAANDPAAVAERAGGREVHRYSRVLRGFSAKLTTSGLDAVRANPNVAYVRADSRVQAIEPAPAAGGATTQPNPPSWGLDRVDQRNLPLNQSFSYDTDGTGTTVYVLDSGIRTTHVDFGTRAQFSYDAVNDGNSPGDCHGHGTHVSGTIGGAAYGVAKDVQLRDVRVLDCFNGGTNANLIEGLDWVTINAGPRSVANLSLGGYGSEVNAAVESMITAGVLAVFAAGNNSGDACGNNPRSPNGVVVGASTVSDSRWSSSNFGSCIDIFAPGDNITSAGRSGDNAVATGWSGTSMATPHVVGWLARYWEANPSATKAQAKGALLLAATTNVLTNIGAGSPNRLMYADPGSTPTDTVAPSTPGTPAASNITSTSATLTWAASTDNVGVVSYDIERAPSGGSFALAGTSATNSFAATGLTAGTAYQFRVRARDAAGNLSPYSPIATVTTSTSTGTCQVTYAIYSGGSTFTSNITITNTGTSTINGWTLAFTLPSGHSFGSGWSAIYGTSGQNVTATSLSWNSTLLPQQTADIGFNGTGAGTAEPTAFTLNGAPCTVA